MNNDDLMACHELIHASGTDEQTEAFSAVVEGLQQEDLENINTYLNCGVASGSDWHDYLKAFSDFEWYQFAYAFHHVMSRDLSLD